jgi:hypothetical protein
MRIRTPAHWPDTLHFSTEQKMFVAFHGGTPRGVRVRLANARGMSGSSAAQIPMPSPPPWRQRAEPSLWTV